MAQKHMRPSVQVHLSSGSAKAPKLRVLEDAATARHKRLHTARHKRLHTEMMVDLTSTHLATKVARMDNSLKKFIKRLLQYEHDFNRLEVL